MSNIGSNSAGKGWHGQQGTIATNPSVGRFESEQATATLYTRGSSAKFNDNDGRKSIIPYSNHGHLFQQQQQQPSSGIVGLRTAPTTLRERARYHLGGHDLQAAAREVSKTKYFQYTVMLTMF